MRLENSELLQNVRGATGGIGKWQGTRRGEGVQALPATNSLMA